MIPVVKGWCTENSIDIASIGIQVHGGVGFIEETGAAQYLRDARITTIYEGTTGIQANDLIGRKLARDGGRAAHEIIIQMRALAESLSGDAGTGAARAGFSSAIDSLERAIGYVVENYGSDIRAVSAGAVPMLKLFGVVAGGWQLLRSALIAQRRLGRIGRGAAMPPSTGRRSPPPVSMRITCCRRRRGWRTASCTARPARSRKACSSGSSQ